MSELRRRAAAVRRAILGPVWIVLIAGLVGTTPALLFVIGGVEEPWIVGPSLFVPVLMSAVATWFHERIERNRDRVGWLYCGWIMGKRRPVGIEDLDCAAQARGLAVVIPECKEEFAYLFVAFAAEYLDRLADLTMSGSPLMYGMEQRGERIESEGVEYAMLLSHNELKTSLLQDGEVLVSLSRHALRQ
ncbi:MAG: hypothetical protein OXQ32_08285 [bacterium]|nr:hypothetical protein [bacterium]